MSSMGQCTSGQGSPIPAAGLPDALKEMISRGEDVREVVATLLAEDEFGRVIREQLAAEEEEAEMAAEGCRGQLEALSVRRRADAEKQMEQERLAIEEEAALQTRLDEERLALEKEVEEAAAKERLAELERQKEECRRRCEELKRTPPPLAVLEVYKAPGSKLTRRFTKWQNRTLVLEAGLMYYYQRSHVVNGKIEPPYGVNIKGYLSLRNVHLYTDFEDMDPEVIILRKLGDEETDLQESKLENDSDEAVAGERDGDVVIKSHIETSKMDVVHQIEEHIKFAQNNDVRTHEAGDRERTKPLEATSTVFKSRYDSRRPSMPKEATSAAPSAEA